MQYKSKFSHKVIAIFFIVTFVPSLLPYNYLFASNNGPKAPEAGSFEPVDATDMVSLLTGDVNYVLPLLDVPSPEGNYPITLAYHGGIAYDQDATWVGLGWNLNPGVINRTINGYPDDWAGGLIRNRNKYEFEVKSINISLGIGEKVQAEIGLGYSWDSNGSQSGSVSLSISDAKTGMSASVGVGYSNTEGWSANAGVSLTRGSNTIGVGADTNGNANVSLSSRNKNGDSVGVSFGTSGLSINAQSSGIGSASYSSNQSVSPDVTTLNVGVKIPLAPKTFLKLGYSKIKYSKNETYLNKVWGPLHYNKLNDNPKTADDVTYSNTISTEHHRDYFMDSYDQPLPESEKEIIDYDDTFEKYQHSFSNPAYDSYVVNAQGLSGSMKPRLLENAYLIGKGYKLEYDTHEVTPEGNFLLDIKDGVSVNPASLLSNNPGLQGAVAIEGDWGGFIANSNIVKKYEKLSAVVNHHFNSSRRFNKRFGNGYNDLHFYFDHQLHSNLLINENTINTNVSSSANNINDFFNGSHDNRIGRVENTNFIETLTNKEINILNNNGGYFLESKDFNRVTQKGARDHGIGAYRITTADGKTYHYSQPVYHYEEFYRQLTPKADSDPEHPENYSEHKFYHEQRKIEPYATHWLLTAITGPDYVKTSGSSIKYPSEGDYGYWIRFDYGAWTDGYVWKNPNKDGNVYNNLVYDKTNAARDYSWGRKQLVYLNKIVTRSHTALFVKSVRDDNEGSQIGIPNAHPYHPDRFPSYEGDHYVYYPKQKSLKLDEIILVKTENDNVQLDNNYGNLVSNPNIPITVDWYTMDDISYPINMQNNVLDNKDLQLGTNGYTIYNDALKVIKLNQDYKLAEDTTNGMQGRLTLNEVEFLGRNATSYMPPYEFEYIGETTNYTPCMDYENCSKDAWGYDRDNVDLWSMNTIKTPLGSEIRIEYEEDDYYTEAFARRYWTEGLTFKVENYSDTQYIITVKNSPDFPIWPDLTDYFNKDEKVGLDLWMVRRRTETSSAIDDCDRFGTAFNLNINQITDDDKMPRVLDVQSNNLEILVDKDLGYGGLFFKPNSGWKNGNILIGQELWQSSTCPSTYDYQEKERGELPTNPGCSSLGSSNRKRHVMSYGLIANKIPVADTGGGVRAKSIATYSSTGDFYKVEYDYKHPYKYENSGLNRSSGITSYAPVRGYKYVTYQAELPGPKVNYEYVTMSQVGMNGESLGKTQYHFDVLKPAINIFSKNLTIGNHFKSEVSESNLPHSTQGADVKLYDNTAMIGSLLDQTEFNSVGHVISKKKNNYKSFDALGSTNQGSLQESFLSMKSIYDLHARYAKVKYNYNLFGDLGDEENSLPISAFVNYTKNLYLEGESSLNLKKRFANVSTKITYPIIQESSEVLSNGHNVKTDYLFPDSKTGEYLMTRTTLSDGTQITNEKVPAYKKYPQMGSKVDHPDNKHMLTQEAMTVTSINNNTLNATITTWKNDWDYRNLDGSKVSPTLDSEKIWRKHKSFVWKDAVDPVNGTYNTPVRIYNDYFDWENNEPTGIGTDKWQMASEITEYTRWSSPVETKDINDNFASSKMSDNYSKVIASGNASLNEMHYSGMEYLEGDNYLDPEINGAAYQSNEMAHTGKFSAKLNVNNAVTVNLNHDQMSSGKYKLSVWASISNYRSLKFKKGSASESFNGETVFACDWVQLNHYFDIQENNSIQEYGVINTTSNTSVYVDDFRIHPVYSSMNSYVYDQDTDELTYILGANNMATKFVYDKAGRLYKTYQEIENPNSKDSDLVNGGFKLLNKYRYNYKDGPDVIANWPNQEECKCCNDNGQDLPPDENGNMTVTVEPCPFDYKTMLSATIKQVKEGSLVQTFSVNHPCIDENQDLQSLGLPSIKWRWLVDYESKTFSDFIEGDILQQVPFTIKPCESKNGTYDKVWHVEAMIPNTDGKPIIISEEIIESGCKLHLSTEKWADIEISTNYNSCSEENIYSLRPYVIKPMHDNYSYTYRTFNHVTNSWSSYLPVTGDKNTFCADPYYITNNYCKSGYSNYQTVQYRVLDNETGDFYQSNPMDIYLDCTTASNPSKIITTTEEHYEYAQNGNVVEKDANGKIINTYNINKR